MDSLEGLHHSGDFQGLCGCSGVALLQAAGSGGRICLWRGKVKDGGSRNDIPFLVRSPEVRVGVVQQLSSKGRNRTLRKKYHSFRQQEQSERGRSFL